MKLYLVSSKKLCSSNVHKIIMYIVVQALKRDYCQGVINHSPPQEIHVSKI